MSIFTKRTRIALFAGAASVVTVAVFSAPSFSKAVTVGPTKIQISVDPGQTVTPPPLFLKNDSSKDETFYPLVQRFSENAQGQKVFTDDSTSIASWLSLPVSVPLKAGEERQIPFTLTAPRDAAPGGHFAVIWWSTSPPGNGGQVSIVTRAGILVYVRVSGNIVEKGSIDSFSGDSFFSWGLPVNFSVDFKNEGNVALVPQGDIHVTNLFGSVKAVIPVNPYGGITLPGSNEGFSALWQGGGFFFGVYRATAHLTYGDSGQSVDATWWFVMISPLGVAILLLIIIALFIAPPIIRRYNRWIIRRAKQ